ncbi:MAG TPA: endonuclease III domain-containing protein [candidate division Zixibacteria bacterium]|nr:endonuclease III domain-containing protein [candidate division Zixibacteria bacterium]
MNAIEEFYRVAFARYGDLEWWPADDPFEVAIGAILTQNTSWKNVERAIERLKCDGLLSPNTISDVPMEKLAEAIRPSGYYNQKAKKLKAFVEWFREELDCDFSAGDTMPTAHLRESLMSVKGIGPETADDILLYAFEKPVFVVDAYTYRIAVRHGWSPPDVGYDELAEIFTSSLDEDVFLYKNFHAILVEIGKTFCTKKAPKCVNCPMKPTLRNGTPLVIV